MTICLPGGGIDKIYHEIIKTLQLVCKSDKIHAIIAAGICDLTRKIHHTGGTQLSYTHTDEDIHSFLKRLDTIQHELLTNNVIPKFATIAPASIIKNTHYNINKGKLQNSKFTNTELKQQQQTHEKHINVINDHVTSLNTSLGIRTIRLDKDVIKISIKKRGANGQSKKRVSRFVYSRMYDGVHADRGLQRKWDTFLCKSVYFDLEGCSCWPDFSDDSEDDTSIDTWDFKRIKNK